MAWRSSDVSSGGDRSSKGPLRLGACVLVAILGGGLIGPGGCSLEVNGITGSSQKACSFALDCDDGDPCTVDVCAGNLCSHQGDAVPDDGNECTVDSCVGGKPVHDGKAAQGMTCGSGGRLVCDDKGQCSGCTEDIECASAGLNPICDHDKHVCITCSDGSKNGDETGVDCGGSRCGRCQGEPCGSGCAAKLTCADGVCCGTKCDGPCEVCNIMPGVCSPVVQGGADPPTCQSPTQACDGNGVCKAAIGQPCKTGGDCANGACRAGTCRRLNGEGCGESEECQSNRCDKGACAPCAKDFDCATSLTCASGVCKGAFGQPCGADSECTLSTCKGGLCRNGNGIPCTDSDQCESGHCAITCGSCNPAGNDCGPAQCAMVNGVNACLLSKGDFCAGNAQCDSGQCAGFPAKCQ